MRYASGAAGPSSAAALAGSRKMPPPMVMLTIVAASPQIPTARTSDASLRERAPASTGAVTLPLRRFHPRLPLKLRIRVPGRQRRCVGHDARETQHDLAEL